MKYVYLLMHGGGFEHDSDFKMCGVYDTIETAMDAKRALMDFPGFKDYPDEFNIDKYELNKTEWSEGFYRS